MRAGLVVARPRPDARRIDLGGRCVLPGFADAHVHFPTWSLGLHQARLEGARSRDEALGRVEAALARVPPGGWLRGLGWREGDWPEPPDRAALDRVTGAVPAALMSKDYHSLWVNSAALERADEPLEMPGGVVERDADGRPAGILRENAAWTFRDRYVRPDLRGDGRGLARGDADRGRTRRDGAPRQGRLARLVRGPPAPARGRRAARARVAVAAMGATRRARGARHPLRASATTCCGSATSRASWTGRSARRPPCSWTARASRSRAARRSRTWFGAPHGRAGRWRSTRSATARTGPRSTPSRRPATSGSPRGLRPRIEHAQLLAPEEFAPLRRDRRDRVGPVQPRPLRPRPRRPALGGQAGRLRLPLARRRGRAARERVGRSRRGARPARRHRRRACAARSTSARRGGPSRRSRSTRRSARPASRPPGSNTRRSVVGCCGPECWPTSSSSTATPTSARPSELGELQGRGDHGRRPLDASRRRMGSRVSATPDLERRAEQLAGGIYGTIVVAGLLAATGPDDDPEVWPTALWVAVTVVVFWLAHSWSLSIARRATGIDAERRGLRRSLAHHWPIVQAACPPLVVMFVGGRPRRDRRDGDPDLGLVLRRAALRLGRRGRAPGARDRLRASS